MRRKSSQNISELLSFDKTEFVEKELVDKITLWMLRAVTKLGGHREFLDTNNRFRDDEVAYFLDLGKYVDRDSDDFKRSEVIAILKSNLIKLEKEKDLQAQRY